MRTTINISDATLDLIRKRSAASGVTFNAALEETIKRGLAADEAPEKPVRLKTFKVGINPAYHGMSLNQLYDQIEGERHLEGRSS